MSADWPPPVISYASVTDWPTRSHRLVPVSRDIHVDDCPEAHWRCAHCGEVWPGYPDGEQNCEEAT